MLKSVGTSSGSGALTGPVTITEAVGSSALTLVGATQTASFPVLNMTQTWNNGATVFTGILLNVTNTASAANSNLLDLQIAGSSVFSVSKDPIVRIGNGVNFENGSGLCAKAINVGSGATCFSAGNLAGEQLNLWTGGNNVVSLQTGGLNLFSTAVITWSSGASVSPIDTYLTRSAAASLRFGNVDAAAPVAQTLGVQNVVAGTSNTAGANWTVNGSIGTGTGAGGDIIFQVAPLGGSGSTQNALVEAARIYSNKTMKTGAGFTVAGLPAAGTAGRRAYVTDATAPSFLGTLTGGGAVKCPVFDNGVAWVAG